MDISGAPHGQPGHNDSSGHNPVEQIDRWIPSFTQTPLRITGFHDFKPVPDKCYFGLNDNGVLHTDKRDLPTLIIGVAFYNENAIELRRTLVSLADQVSELKDIAICQVLFVSDGHRQMRHDTKEFFRHIFCRTVEESENWTKLMNKLDEYCIEVDQANNDEANGVATEHAKKKPDHLTFVVQRTGFNINNDGSNVIIRQNVNIPGAKDRKMRQLPLSLIIKASNRRKHNSQEWILDSFAKQAVRNDRPDADDQRYVFMSDCGTLYDPQCLLRLVLYMHSHPLCVGCTGRQRVMTAEEQDEGDEGILSVGKFFRIIQLADYEASYAVYTAAFAAAGFLPVLPGPCALFRYSGLLSERKFRSLDPLEIELAKDITNSVVSIPSSDIAVLNENRELVKSESTTSMSHVIFVSGSEEDSNGSPYNESLEEIVIETPDYMSINLIGQERAKETALEHFGSIVATPPEDTDLVIENVKLAEDRIPSYAIVTHGKAGAYTTWVDGATFKFQAETDLRSFVLQRRRWINGAFLCYIFSVLAKPHLILGSSHNIFRRIMIYILFFTQMVNYLLAAVSPAIFCSALYLALVSLLNTDSPGILAVVVVYAAFIIFFMWVHRYLVFVKPLFYLMVVANAVGMCIILAGYINQGLRWDFAPPGVDYSIILYATLGIIGMPFLMALVALDFKSFGYLVISFVPYILYLPTLVGTFTVYSMSRLSDTSWGQRTTVAGSSFKSATHKQLADLQADMSSNASVALVFITLANIVIGVVVVYFHSNSWFIVGCMCTLFATIGVQATISFIYFVVKHITCQTCRQRIAKKKKNMESVVNLRQIRIDNQLNPGAVQVINV
jgi:cellulose synthase/poly-beta-1,6-N-acetylglucosamine synthase-like glycosyltransferase